jgi:hypothetical protein
LGVHHQHLVRRFVLSLTLWVLALAFVAPPCALALDGRAQVAETASLRDVAPPVASRPSPGAPASARQVVHSSRAAKVSSLTLRSSPARLVVAPFASAHGPRFDGGELYLDHCSLLC